MRIIAGRWRGHAIRAPKGRAVRPTSDRVREAWMGALHQRLAGARVLDLFAGTGALGLEALSRGASHVQFVDRARGACALIERNIRILEAESWVKVVHADAFKHLTHVEPGAFDIAVADPPYGLGFETQLFERFAERPFASELWVEHRTRDSVPSLPGLQQRRYGDTTLSHVFATEAEAGTVEDHLRGEE